MKIFNVFKRKTSGTVARERLKQLLLTDRMNLSTDVAERIHKDISKCLSKYLDIDEKKISVQFEKDQSSKETFIKINVPVISMKMRR